MKNLYKNPRVQAAGLIVVLAVIGWLVFKQPKTEVDSKPSNSAPNAETQNQSSQKNPDQNLAQWEGVLKLSNNNQKGNLMLVTKERIIYLKTNRDFSALVNKEVVVTYEGTLDSFRLGEINAK
ncbi:MAG: hypothetical protein NTX98_01025 [Candidatus Doudnabacteria bacterium]|nr:hypothetical protein [Candidatus Doudnabacteria bacterium]